MGSSTKSMSRTSRTFCQKSSLRFAEPLDLCSRQHPLQSISKRTLCTDSLLLPGHVHRCVQKAFANTTVQRLRPQPTHQLFHRHSSCTAVLSIEGLDCRGCGPEQPSPTVQSTAQACPIHADTSFALQNLIRGRGVFCRSIMKSQLASPTFTPTYAALVAIINTKFPEIGELLLKRVISQVLPHTSLSLNTHAHPCRPSCASSYVHCWHSGSPHALLVALSISHTPIQPQHHQQSHIPLQVHHCVCCYTMQQTQPSAPSNAFAEFSRQVE